MRQVTFKDTYILGDIVNENNLFIHYHYPEMLMRYDSNFIEFKTMPSLVEFKEAERYLKEFHLRKGQKHVKFYFPENVNLTEELITYLTDTSYEMGFLKLYVIEPKCFPAVENNSEIDIQLVTDKTLAALLDLQYKNSIEYGEAFAKQKLALIKRQFINPAIQQLLAFYKGEPVGYLDIISTSKTIEIDDLSVNQTFQRKGIGSQLQRFVMDSFPDKIVLLMADGEDTPREMYKKQQYKNVGFKYEVQKIEED
jgi:ribosomal protein S18 acetylase RimI-like enzyme